MRSGLVSLALLGCAQAVLAQPAGDGIVPFRGRLERDGVAQNQPHDFRFTIKNASGSDVWSGLFLAVPVVNGNFSVLLGANPAFADTVWDQPDLFLQIEVRRDAGSAWTLLEGRQRLLSVPYAQRSKRAADFRVTGALEVGSATTLRSNLDVEGDLAVDRILGRSGPVHAGNGLQVTGDVDASGQFGLGIYARTCNPATAGNCFCNDPDHLLSWGATCSGSGNAIYSALFASGTPPHGIQVTCFHHFTQNLAAAGTVQVLCGRVR